MATPTETTHYASNLDEKPHPVTVDTVYESEKKEFEEIHQPVVKHEYGTHVDLPEGLPEEGNALTVRALVVGVILGSIVAASNIYLGLKTGFTFGASLFGAIGGWFILQIITTITGGYFGIKENCTVQTAATAAGGLSTLFVAALPAMYALDLLGASPREDAGKIIALTFITAYYGLFFAIPFRKYFILKMKLVFPTPFASAATIASLHSVHGAAVGRKKALIMFGSMGGAFLWKIIGSWMPGIYSWYVMYWFSTAGCEACFTANLWTWRIEWTPAFLGAGMLSGVHASVSFWIGTLTAWGIVGPILVAKGVVKASSFTGMPKPGQTLTAPTARYWLLWPGIMIMIAASFTELFWNWRSIWAGVKGIFVKSDGTEEDIVDPAPAHEQVPMWMWASGIVASSILTITICSTMFGVGVGESILAIILGFIFAFIGIQAAGTTDINPVGAIAKTAQFVFGGMSRAQGKTVQPALNNAMMQNLVAGSIAAGSASQATDMVGDLKTGHLLRASPRTQFYAQAIGTFFAVFISVGLYIFYVDAYPCINQALADVECEFDLASATAWAVTTTALTSPDAGIPGSSGIAAIILGLLTVALIVARKTLPPKISWIIPNMSALGVAWVVQDTSYANAMLIGSMILLVWERRNPESWNVWGFALASGLIAGEGLAGLALAAIKIAKYKFDEHGTAVGCPSDEFGGESVFCG
ncbi:OPT oligopeptide transporter protein-domain-containing protein [Fimicolochytrium jonesii]|uniref:OPT oligopeptide transporter protein-domain-containing protein n=1 Tax=Fimicolochytrium jonesii TaxID=1396493 RepID=UPI0022FED37D|nr:OPT oligopeptide transporter protein-domain-containing protein [Fimicolochytrium jonesii]KAI8817268.1 OPT oligopeptide transporter protein-domain-containing protein [Fimicolochytrium jonesii]